MRTSCISSGGMECCCRSSLIASSVAWLGIRQAHILIVQEFAFFASVLADGWGESQKETMSGRGPDDGMALAAWTWYNKALQHPNTPDRCGPMYAAVTLRIPRISATQSTGMLPRNPWECCHPVQRISAIDSTGMLPSSLRHACHPRSVATLDRMISLGSLLLSMAVASAVHFFAVLPPGQQMRFSPMRRAPRQLGNAASRWSLGAPRRWACLIYADGALANVACPLRMESPFKAIL